jgi:hypothetical protein
MRSALVRSTFAVVVVLASPVAIAQSAGPSAARAAPLAESLTGPAKEAYDSAKVLLNNHDWAGAFTKFQQAYDLSKDPRLLFNMAVCARDMREYARTEQLLVRYEHEAGASLSSDEKAQVDAALATVRALVARVKLDVSEDGASVAVDGNPAGTTPLPAPLVIDLGKHTLSVSKPGFEPVGRTIESVGGSEARIAITLVQQVHLARLTVVAELGAVVSVDKKQVGTDRFDGSLAPGMHEILVTSPGKKAYSALVDLRDGEARTLQVTLAAEPHAAPVWPWIVGGAVVAAGAAVGGYFLFRPHDERGPFPNGSLGTVPLTFRMGGR